MDKDTFMSPKTAIENGFADGMLLRMERTMKAAR